MLPGVVVAVVEGPDERGGAMKRAEVGVSDWGTEGESDAPA